ncbi:MAG TPA: GGDEF domain-containing protein [Candidatus Deferrimicrobiaceae bacterium]|jgi:diguanylate cyclase (GGDEF)-like protein
MSSNGGIRFPEDPDGGWIHRAFVAIVDRLNRVPAPVILASGYLFVAVLGVIDYFTSSDLSFLIFYLVPVFVVTFFVGSWAGTILSVACTAVWFGVNTRELMADAATVIPFWNIAQKLAFFFLMTWLLGALKKAMMHVQAQARIDPLTGLPNRRTFQEVAAAEIHRSRRYKRPFTFAYIDLDRFKSVNDTRGHAEGDRLLCAVSDTLREALREVDLAVRLGGDEFALLLPETDYASAQTAVSNLRDRLILVMEAHGWPVTFTIGVVTYEEAVHSVDEMIGLGDQLMYKGKQTGKNVIIHRRIDA